MGNGRRLGACVMMTGMDVTAPVSAMRQPVEYPRKAAVILVDFVSVRGTLFVCGKGGGVSMILLPT